MKTTFIGTVMAQTPRAIALWEKVLNENEFKRIIEIGSYKWGMSLLFYLFCLQKKAEFYTYDVEKFTPPRVVREIGLTKHFKMLDVFSIEKEIGKLIQKEGKTIVYCDGGNKANELEVFHKYLKSGDIIAVHDWGTEIDAYPNTLIEIYAKECDGEGLTRIFHA